MKKVSVILMCGWCAAAFGQQAQVQYTWEWSEVLAGTATPSSATPGVIDPTEGVRLALHASFTPGVGQPVSFFMSGQTQTGPVYSWGLSAMVLRGGVGTTGAFSHLETASGFQSTTFNVQSPGVVSVDAASDWHISPGAVPTNTSNPIQGLISFTWTPASYSPRMVSFVGENVISGAPPNQLLVQYGTGPTGSPLLWFVGAQPNHGPGTGGIPIVPGPGGALAAMMAWAMVARRRPSGE